MFEMILRVRNITTAVLTFFRGHIDIGTKFLLQYVLVAHVRLETTRGHHPTESV